MAKQKETYPVVTAENAGAYTAILDQYRQSITAGAPYPVEWLTACITQGLLLPIEDYVADIREGLEAVAKAEAAAQAAAAEKVEWLGESPDQLEESEAAPAVEEQQEEAPAATDAETPTGAPAGGADA